MTREARIPRRPLRATIALVVMYLWYSIEVMVAFIRVGSLHTVPDRSVFGVVEPAILMLVTVGAYLIVVASAPSVERWLSVAIIGAILGFGMVQEYKALLPGSGQSEVQYVSDSSGAVGAVIFALAVCLVLTLYYTKDPQTDS